jgi:hypothetical protein
MSKWVLDSTSTARVYAIGSDAGFLMLDKLELVGFNYYYASAYAIGS